MEYYDDEIEAGAPARRAAGPSRSVEDQVPEFGPGQLIAEVDCERLSSPAVVAPQKRRAPVSPV